MDVREHRTAETDAAVRCLSPRPSDGLNSYEWRCPTCRALYKRGTQCYRCQCDLSVLLRILEQAAQLKGQAVCLLREGRPEEAMEAIRQSLFLHRNLESLKIAALISASQGDFGKILKQLTP